MLALHEIYVLLMYYRTNSQSPQPGIGQYYYSVHQCKYDEYRVTHGYATQELVVLTNKLDSTPESNKLDEPTNICFEWIKFLLLKLITYSQVKVVTIFRLPLNYGSQNINPYNNDHSSIGNHPHTHKVEKNICPQIQWERYHILW